MNITLIANNSALTSALVSQLHSSGYSVLVVNPGEMVNLNSKILSDSILLDMGSFSQLQKAAYGDKDFVFNLEARKTLIELCDSLATPYIWLGDAQVFVHDEHKVSYHEADECLADSFAAVQLRAFERLVLQADRALVLRTGSIVAAAGDNFLTACATALQQGRQLDLDSSRQLTTTPVVDLARVLSAMIDQLRCDAQCRGVYHYNSTGLTTAYELAEKVYAVASQIVNLPAQDSVIVSTAKAEQWQPDMPILSCDRLLQNFGIRQLPWHTYLPKMIKTLCEEQVK